MEIIAIKTRIVKIPKDNIFDLFENLSIKDKDIILVTSKIISIHQGRCIPIDSVNKDELIKKEADYYISRDKVPGKAAVLTIKNSTLLASAGIDENKNEGCYILLPQQPENMARDICLYLKKKFSLKNLAVVITDSHTMPLRPGVVGISIGFFGLEPYKKYIDKNGDEIVASKVNIIDSLASAAVLAMGEYDEQTPLAIIRNASQVSFTTKETYKDTYLSIKKDIYYPLLKNFIKNNNK